jgi:cell wall-associated NlpC family hydrolase
MLMRKHLYLVTAACLLLTLLPGCHTHKKYASNHSSRKPQFINDIYINGHNKSSATENAIAHTSPKKHTEKNSGKNAHENVDDHADERVELDPRELKRKYADILGVRTKEIDNTTLYRFIDRWYGTNYRLGGQDKEGIDCSGFAQKLYGEVYGVDLLRTAMEQFSSCKRIKHASSAEEGDLVFFHIHSKRITHVGVYLGNNYFVHSSTSGGVIISNLNEDYWKKYYAGMGRVPKG